MRPILSEQTARPETEWPDATTELQNFPTEQTAAVQINFLKIDIQVKRLRNRIPGFSSAADRQIMAAITGGQYGLSTSLALDEQSSKLSIKAS